MMKNEEQKSEVEICNPSEKWKKAFSSMDCLNIIEWKLNEHIYVEFSLWLEYMWDGNEIRLKKNLKKEGELYNILFWLLCYEEMC